MIIDHPYQFAAGGQWLRGNLHTHTTRSDGSADPQAVIDDYAGRKYDFLMISDHDIHTTAADHAAWDAKGMVLLSGNEISRGGPHLLHVGGRAKVEPDPLRQQVLNTTAADDTGFAIVNHPNWGPDFNHCPFEAMEQWVGYIGLEIYNGVISRLPGSPYATDKWDRLLKRGRRVWGFANDDSHAPQDVGLGWNVAWCESRTPDAVIDALRNGRFYASTGVEITRIAVEGAAITIETNNARRIVALQSGAKRFATADDRAITVQPPENAGYVRFECWGDGESSAWTQPFWMGDES